MGVVGSWVEAHGLWVVVVVKKEIVLVRVYVADTGAGTGGREPVQRAGHSVSRPHSCALAWIVCVFWAAAPSCVGVSGRQARTVRRLNTHGTRAARTAPWMPA